MTLAVDCRMCGKSGIGAFIDGILPYLIATEHKFLLLGLDDTQKIETLPPTVYEAQNVTLLPCHVAPFSLTETFFFPKTYTKRINQCDAFISPYCNIPSGIRIPIFSTIHDIVFFDMPDLQKPFLPLPAKTDTIIFIGNIKRHKGLHTLIPAFAQLRTACKEQHLPLPTLVIVGSQENFRTKDDTLRDLAQTDGIRFTGFVTNETLKRLLSEAKLLVQPSLYEGFGLPPMEALCCGTAAVVSDIPVFKEVYEGLPVTYFKSEDSADLAETLISLWKNYTPPLPQKNRYSFAKTATAIMEKI